MREVIITSISLGFDHKNHFFEGWPWFKFNNLGLALNMALKFYTSVAKKLILKVRKFLALIPTFVTVTGEKLVGGFFTLNGVITSKTAMSWNSQKKKECIFVKCIWSERIFFYICILSQSIVY